MKKKLLLETVLKLKVDLEKSIVGTFDSMIKYNFTEKKIDALLDRLDKMEKQLIHFKEVIQEANLGKIKGVTNFFNIFYLSNLTAKKNFYDSLLKTYKYRTPAKLKLAQIVEDTARTRSNELGEEITKFQQKLSEFNSKKKVTVYLDEDLNLL